VANRGFFELTDARRRRRGDRWVTAGGLFGGLLGVALILAPIVQLPYSTLAPGQTADVTRRLEVTSGGPAYDTKGRLLLATVGVRRKNTAAQLLRAWLDDGVDVKREKELFGNESSKESTRRSQADMDDSKLVATVAALRELDRPPQGEGVRVRYVEPTFPSAKKLAEGDVIVTANGNDLCLAQDLGTVVRALPEGKAVTLEVLKKAGGTKATVEIVPKWLPEYGFGLLGVDGETVKCNPNVAVKVDTGAIGGPSAGLAITLGLYDRLTPGELTEGLVVAATGTIGADGRVGIVGGVKQKTIAVRSAGAKLFLVPRGEESEAQEFAGDMRVIPVSSLDDALTALRNEAAQRSGG
jgi:Lon-like protease